MTSLLALAAIASHQTAQWVVVFDQTTGENRPPLSTTNDPYARLTAGVSVDRTNGDVYLLANNVGICKSTDQGEAHSRSFPETSSPADSKPAADSTSTPPAGG